MMDKDIEKCIAKDLMLASPFAPDVIGTWYPETRVGENTIGFPMNTTAVAPRSSSGQIKVHIGNNCVTLMNEEEVFRGLAQGSIVPTSGGFELAGLDSYSSWDTWRNVTTNSSSGAAIYEMKKAEELEKENDFLDDTDKLRKIIKLKRYAKKLNFSFGEPVTIQTFSLVPGIDDKMDIMLKSFTGGEKLVLRTILIPLDEKRPYRVYRFQFDGKQEFVDIEEDRCFDWVDGFSALMDALENEKKIAHRKYLKAIEEQRKKEEELELSRIVEQNIKEEMGYGTWS